MIATQDALLRLWPIYVLGILAFGDILVLFNIRGPWWFQIALCAGMAALIYHFWGG